MDLKEIEKREKKRQYDKARREKRKEHFKKYHAENKEKISAKKKIWAKEKKDVKNQINRRYRLNIKLKEIDMEIQRARAKEKYQANKEYYIEKAKKWVADNLEKRKAYRREYMREYRARNKQA